MKKTVSKLKSRCGSVYIRCAVIIMLLSTLLSAVLFYSESMSVAKAVKKRLTQSVDGYLTSESIGIYGALDDGTDRITSLLGNFDTLFYDTFDGLRKNADGSVSCTDGEGNTEYTVCFPAVSLSGENLLRITADLYVIIPVRFAGIVITQMNVPIRINSKYVSKY